MNLLSLEEFKANAKEHFGNYLGTDFQNKELCFSTEYSINKIKTCIRFKESESNTYTGKAVYLDDMYYYYQNKASLEETYIKFAEIVQSKLAFKPEDFNVFESKEYILDHLFAQVINQKMNQEFLENVPHICILDLAVIFNVYISIPDSEQHTSYHLTYAMMEEHDIDMNIVCSKAFANDKRLFGNHFSANIHKVLPEIPDVGMHIITNVNDTYGANAIYLYPWLFEELSKELNSDLLILPYSTNELLVLGKNGPMAIEYLLQCEQIANSIKPITVDTYLTNSLYLYSIKKGFCILSPVK
ncbi:MAG: DUF5688 family protein [Lachnospiraceae bacterium]